MARRSIRSPLLLSLLLGTACPDDPPSTGGSSSDGTTSTGSTTDGGPTTTTSPDSTSASGSASGEGSSSSGGVADSTSTSVGSTDTGSESSSGTTGPLPASGCADGEREALVDEVMYPDIAACGGGWSIPGVLTGTPLCNNQGGDDGPLPNGMGCTIDDLCAEGWHLCQSAMEVADAGITSCSELTWDGSFFATRQSSMAMDTCSAVGTNDVFGCGDIGLTAIVNCNPLNRSTGNLCGELPAPWECDVEANSEAEFLLKEAPELGGALCCRD
ncbi:MAG: hypothetical protein KDK70_11270 [Myxococcales bacterium]|nr:hypothetical protein [Myxococcales bacterium]